MDLQRTIVSCHECTRLREHCQKIAEVKRKAYLNETYWGKPITGFGDPLARLMIVGLAPGAHGANRTGRVFTGDKSGEWLYRALHKAGFANQPLSQGLKDGLTLHDAYITCVVKCAPPDNKPTPEEQKTCEKYLIQELELLTRVRVYVALGEIAFRGLWSLLQSQVESREKSVKRPDFRHGGQISLTPAPGSKEQRWLLLSYHPSQQNTFTKRLSEPSFDLIFSTANELLGRTHGH